MPNREARGERRRHRYLKRRSPTLSAEGGLSSTRGSSRRVRVQGHHVSETGLRTRPQAFRDRTSIGLHANDRWPPAAARSARCVGWTGALHDPDASRLSSDPVIRLNRTAVARRVRPRVWALTLLVGVVACASPAATTRDTLVAGGEPPPRFVTGGPDAEEFGASMGYPKGSAATYWRISRSSRSSFRCGTGAAPGLR